MGVTLEGWFESDQMPNRATPKSTDDMECQSGQRECSESPGGTRERPWSKILSDTSIGRLADSSVNEKRFCIGFALVLVPLLSQTLRAPEICAKAEPAEVERWRDHAKYRPK